ncbi:12643_t:CDS:2, partial [Funneliformis mosseae]
MYMDKKSIGLSFTTYGITSIYPLSGRIREALPELFDVVLDERDEQNLAEMEEQKAGEEANIVIISLVRSFSLGFLKSTNRINVLLSRAREGMYLIVNTELMETRSNDMWASIINILRKRNLPQIGFGMPIECNKHPECKNVIVEPEQFELINDPQHLGTKCLKPCPRSHPVCYHPCPKICYEDCGQCNFPIGDIILPGCGHVIKNATCWQNQKMFSDLKCGHDCSGVCDEICPSKDFCIICAPEHVKRQESDAIKKILFSKVNWKKKRMIVLSCGHVFTKETMDMHMGMEVYHESEGIFERKWTSIKILPALTTNDNMKDKKKLLYGLSHLPADDSRLNEITYEEPSNILYTRLYLINIMKRLENIMDLINS